MTISKYHWSDFLNPAFLGEVIVFTGTQLLGLYLALRINYVPGLKVTSAGVNPVYFLIAFILLTVVIVLLVKKVSRPWVFQAFFFLAVFEGLSIVGRGLGFQPIIFSVILIALYLAIYNLYLHNLILVLTIAGLGVLLGSSLSVLSAILILLFLAVYDYIAVNKTKHMISMFKGMAEKQVFFAVIFPYKLSGYKHSVNLVKIDQNYMFLGTGDLAVPLIFLISVQLNQPALTGWTLCGAIGGLILLYFQYLNRQERKALPGLPAIVFGTLVGYLIGYFLA